MTAPREVTAETLTDADILDWRRSLIAAGGSDTAYAADCDDAVSQALVLAPGSALDAVHGTWIPSERRRSARTRIAAAINTRSSLVDRAIGEHTCEECEPTTKEAKP